jgi:hypothetical protein
MIKGMIGTWFARFFLEFSQELDIGHLPTLFLLHCITFGAIPSRYMQPVITQPPHSSTPLT